MNDLLMWKAKLEDHYTFLNMRRKFICDAAQNKRLLKCRKMQQQTWRSSAANFINRRHSDVWLSRD